MPPPYRGMLTVQEFRALGDRLFGYGWQSALARRYGVHSRTVRRWASGKAAIPVWIQQALRDLDAAGGPAREQEGAAA